MLMLAISPLAIIIPAAAAAAGIGIAVLWGRGGGGGGEEPPPGPIPPIPDPTPDDGEDDKPEGNAGACAKCAETGQPYNCRRYHSPAPVIRDFNRLGYTVTKLSGDGQSTAEIMRFQTAARGLHFAGAVDGVPGPCTLIALEAMTRAREQGDG